MSFWDLFSDSNERLGKKQLKEGLDTAQADAFSQLDQGTATANDSYDKALGLYAPLEGSTSLYADALGLNGADGNARATGAYQTSPGYESSVNSAIQALERRAASQGQLGSGNTSIDTLGTVYNLADQDYSSWLDRLNGASDRVTTGEGAIYGTKGANATQTGTTKANYAYNTGVTKANADYQYQIGKDATGANIFGAVTGGISLGSKLLGL